MTRITALLERWFDEHERSALDRAIELVAQEPVDLAELLRWVDASAADDEPRDLAIRRIRAAVGLPPMPGAVCRPFDSNPPGRRPR